MDATLPEPRGKDFWHPQYSDYKERMVASVLVLWTALSAAPAVTVDAGEIWERRCQGCHGVDGRAHTRTGQRESIDDFTESEWQIANTDDHIRETITEGSRGNAKMKSFKTVLTPGEIEALVLYIRALGVHGAPSE